LAGRRCTAQLQRSLGRSDLELQAGGYLAYDAQKLPPPSKMPVLTQTRCTALTSRNFTFTVCTSLHLEIPTMFLCGASRKRPRKDIVKIPKNHPMRHILVSCSTLRLGGRTGSSGMSGFWTCAGTKWCPLRPRIAPQVKTSKRRVGGCLKVLRAGSKARWMLSLMAVGGFLRFTSSSTMWITCPRLRPRRDSSLTISRSPGAKRSSVPSIPR
jgi:hypothetical protein